VTPRVNAPENEGAVGIGLGSPLAYKSYPVWKAVPMGFRPATTPSSTCTWASAPPSAARSPSR
jgi:hypothetical protein